MKHWHKVRKDGRRLGWIRRRRRVREMWERFVEELGRVCEEGKSTWEGL